MWRRHDEIMLRILRQFADDVARLIIFRILSNLRRERAFFSTAPALLNLPETCNIDFHKQKKSGKIVVDNYNDYAAFLEMRFFRRTKAPFLRRQSVK